MSEPSQTDDGLIAAKHRSVEINLYVLPRSSRCEIAGIYNNSLRIKVTSPPVDNKANAQCCEIIAEILGMPKRAVSIIRGKASRQKVMRIEGMTEKEVKQKLLKL